MKKKKKATFPITLKKYFLETRIPTNIRHRQQSGLLQKVETLQNAFTFPDKGTRYKRMNK